MIDYAEVVASIKTCKDWLNVFTRSDIDAVDLGYYLSKYDYDETPYEYLGNIDVDSIDYSNATFLGIPFSSSPKVIGLSAIFTPQYGPTSDFL